MFVGHPYDDKLNERLTENDKLRKALEDIPLLQYT